MDSEIERRLKQIDTEYFIWIIYLIIIGLSMYANSYEKKYFTNNDNNAKEKYHHLCIIIFSIAVIIYIYFLVDNYKDYESTKYSPNQKKKNLNELSLLGSSLVFISGIIFLYIAIVDKNLDIEIAFN